VDDTSLDTKLNKFLVNEHVQLYLLICTFFALFADDYRLISSPKNTDYLYDIFTIICIASFSAEIVISLFCKTGYRCSYFFWLDLISTISLIMDIVLIKEYIIELG
jgi:hypothetical protein